MSFLYFYLSTLCFGIIKVQVHRCIIVLLFVSAIRLCYVALVFFYSPLRVCWMLLGSCNCYEGRCTRPCHSGCFKI